MHQSVLRSTCLALALLGTASLSAHSQTTLNGFVSGVELCEQAVCGSAIFVAGFAGEIADRPAVGLAVGGIIHDALPTIDGAHGRDQGWPVVDSRAAPDARRRGHGRHA